MMEEKSFQDSDSDDPDFQIASENLSNESSVSESESTTSESNKLSNFSVKLKKKKKNKTNSFLSNIDTHVADLKKNGNRDTISTPAKEKERTDLLWNNFLNSTGAQSKNCETSISKLANDSNMSKESESNKDMDLKKDREPHSSITRTNSFKLNSEGFDRDTKSQIPVQQSNILKRRGISNILNTISKRSKVSTLEKSKQDWNEFKEKHNLNEEITNFNRGKNGYLERQDFLQRTDSRQFEIEKELRNCGRRKSNNL